MTQYRIRVQREVTFVVDAPSTEEAERAAKTMVANDKALKLLDLIRLDLLNPEERPT